VSSGPAIGQDLMAFMTRTLDRNGNGTLEANEARVAGNVGNGNGINGTQETARALKSGNALLYGFQFARGAAESIANRLSGGDGTVSRKDLNFTPAALDRVDTTNDGRISREELATALQRGGLAINARQVTTADEAKDRLGRPTPPPPSGSRPAPPPPGYRPPPPQVSSGRSPNEIVQRTKSLLQDLRSTYSSTSMSTSERDVHANRIVEQSVSALLAETRFAPLPERKAALQAIYQGSPMSTTRRDQVEALLVSAAIEDVGNASYPNWGAAKAAVQAIYQGSSMNTTQRDQLEARLLTKEVDKIEFGSFPSFADRRRALDNLYQRSSMSSSQRDEIAARLERVEIDRRLAPSF
jgi:hypothetical protein